MKKQNLADLRVEDLIKKHKSLKTTTIILMIVIVVFIILITASVLNFESSYYIVLPVIFLPNLLINFLMIKKVRTEIESRK